jgi:hypothetical protein
MTTPDDARREHDCVELQAAGHRDVLGSVTVIVFP